MESSPSATIHAAGLRVPRGGPAWLLPSLPMPRSGLVVLALFLTACPAVNSAPCASDEECPGGACRDGACGPQCLLDLDCTAGEVCRGGSCVPAPQCATADDCAAGFQCTTQLQCQCVSDSACALNEACIEGGCRVRPACTSDADCAPFGLLCELNQGLCVPPCSSAADCAPGVDPTLAEVLFACEAGACFQRCLNATTCAAGMLCESGVCKAPQCTTPADCPQGSYCTSAAGGSCLPYQPCSGDAECPPNFGCSLFPPGGCPPGVDCALKACRELPACLVDADCAQPAYCQDQHCQPASTCNTSVPCPAGQQCYAGTCAPSGCRGHEDCAAGEACVYGACATAPAPASIRALALFPARLPLRVGDAAQVKLVAFNTDGSTFPLAEASFTADTGAVAVTSTGVITALQPGAARVRAAVTGSAATAAELRVDVVAAAATGELRVLVIDAATRAPLPDVQVIACDGPCTELLTAADGTATFAVTGATVDLSAASPVVRTDGFPEYDRVSVIATAGRDVLLPLTHNPVHADAPFTASYDFSNVHTQGPWWIGLALPSSEGLLQLDARRLLGEPFVATLPGTNLRATLPGAFAVSFEAGFGAPIPLEDRSHGLGEPGLHAVTGFAGRIDPAQGSSFNPAALLQYVGALDVAVDPGRSFPWLPRTPDTQDLDGDRLCADATRCPNGTEDLPAYASGPAPGFAPSREQTFRTEVQLPPPPPGLPTTLVAQVQAVPGRGLAVHGLSSGTGTVVLRGGAPGGAMVAGVPGLWAIATALDANGIPFGPQSARLVTQPALPPQLALAPFLPLPGGAQLTPAARTVSLDTARWDALAAAGATLGRIVLADPDSRQVVYFAPAQGLSQLTLPPSPTGAGTDAAQSALSTVEETALAGVTLDEALDLPGPNLAAPERLFEAASRSP